MTDMSTFSPGSTWRFSADYGFGPGYLPAGAEVTVTGVYPPGTPGLGAADEDTVLADFPRPNAAPQTIAVPASQFAALTKAVS